MQTGNLSIHSENILPIIKKWLYSDQDIFVRELVSNGVDAITKLKKLADMGEAENISQEEAFAIHVRVDKENKQIIIEDNGIGMTEDEVKEYINQIAFSGASAFLEKYKDETTNEIIGHFGLGFYSSFMVAEKVQIDTLSFRENAEPVRWECEGGIEYAMSPSDKATRGTKITLFVSQEGEEFLDEFKLRGVISKHCGFMPVPIYLEDMAKPEPETKGENDDAETETTPEPINDTHPLWLKPANECTDEEYKAFYQKVFMDFKPPLFWIHLNMDYPFRLKGILFFPSLKHDPEYMEGQVKLFNNQVYVADNIKEVIPEYLLLLKGVMDCPDLPLNVSRSFLQNDSTVKQMSGYISRKVAEKLNGLFKKDRDTYNGYWDDIAPFIKYGCIKERDF
ncbi:MAG: molecular chaperone HtpG, partial [Defluviitaleaceae bacterium]|nr:molecular chaperone HtpG [Defluviitaleaceae bacterium]